MSLHLQVFLSKGEYAKASKFFDKSLRLFPLAGVKALKEKADRLAAGEWMIVVLLVTNN